MDCFLSAVRESVFSKMSGNYGAPEADDAFWGFFKRAFSTSSSSSSSYDADQARQAPFNLKRQRAAAFFMGCFLCGINESAREEEGHDMNSQCGVKEGHVQLKEGQYTQDIGVQWWQESGKKRRKLGSNKWVAGKGNGNILSSAPAKLTRLLRKVRAEVRKLGQFQKAASFHYDPLSYSMNFDDGCWHHCDSHAKLFLSAASPREDVKLQCKKGRGPPSAIIVKAGSKSCLWQRRQVRQPKTLRITRGRAFLL